MSEQSGPITREQVERAIEGVRNIDYRELPPGWRDEFTRWRDEFTRWRDELAAPTAIISEEPARVRPAPTTEVARIAQDLTEECKRLAPELGAAVRHIADRRVRAAVADAAWLLEELGAA